MLMNTDSNYHSEFNDKVSKEMYNYLELLCAVTNGHTVPSADLALIETIKKMIDINNMDRLMNENKMKLSICYIRICKIIKSLLNEYADYEEAFKKDIIDYYIKLNSIKEMNTLGFAWYYDMKFKKDVATLYSAGYGEVSNWSEWFRKHMDENNTIKQRRLQLIFHACKEHINRGGEIRLKSLSKCFGVDLFKYMQLDENGTANLYVIKDALINFIKYNGSCGALQKYISSDSYGSFDGGENLEFCLDFSHPRNEKAKNFKRWSTDFLEDSSFISQAEFEESKNSLGVNDDMFNFFILDILCKKHLEGADKAISSRISPIADKEIIASNTLWEIKKYTPGFDVNVLPEICYHISFDESEYYQLIFNYFNSYYEKGCKGKEPFHEKYVIQLAQEKEFIHNNIQKLQKENEDMSNPDNPSTQHKDLESIERKNDVLIKFYQSYEEALDKVITDGENKKIQFALSFIDWNVEMIPTNWALDNIYHVKKCHEKNLRLNLYKCLCKIVAT